MGDEIDFDKKKAHSHRHAGRKAEKKKVKNKHEQDSTAQQRNPKAFAFKSAAKAQKQFLRTQDFKSKKHHIPVVDRTPLEPPPVIVSIVGGPKSGKSTLLRCLIKNYTRQKLSDIQGPVTVVVGKKRRVTFIEVNNDINCMIDIAKVSDIVLMLIDATFGIEMEIFEFLEICRAHGTPRVMGILNHLDMMKDNKALKKKKKVLKHRFQVELYPGAKLFYLSGIVHGEYLKKEVQNLGRFIMVMKFRPLTWRISHPYVLVDRYEDITNLEKIRTNPKCDRDVVLYGYVRGVPFQKSQMVHIPGCGDFRMKNITYLPDPCPLPEHLKKRSLNAKERLLFAPMSGVGGVLYDKDAVYIDLGGSHHGVRKQNEEWMDRDEDVLQPLLELQKTADEKQAESKIQIFSNSDFISNAAVSDKDRDMEDEDEQVKERNDEADDSGNRLGSRREMPEYETVTDSNGVRRRRVIFADNLEEDDKFDDEDDDDDETDGSESDDDVLSEEEEEEHDLAPPKKKMKNVSVKSVKEETNESESDDDYDVDGDLQELLRSGGKQLDESLKDESAKENTKPSTVQRTQTLKNNKDSDVTVMIQGILENLKTHPIKKVQRTSDNDGVGLEKKGQPESTDDIREQKMTSEIKSESDTASSEDEEESEDDKDGMLYRTDMFQEATDNYYKNQAGVSFLRKYIYGDLKEDESSSESEDESVGGLFRKTSSQPKKKSGLLSKRGLMDDTDTTRYIPHVMRDWNVKELQNSIKDCFMTGEWKEGEDAETLLKMDEEDEDLYGDFEDLETGEKFKAAKKEDSQKEVDEEKAPEVKKEEMSAKEKRLEKKRKLKAMFDEEYDDNGNEDYFESLKKDLNEQAELNRKEFEGLDDETRVQYEGFRAGMYVRMEFERFPCEFITNFDPSYPVIAGGLLENENNNGFIRVRIKVHRWYPKILKNRDPLILSLGWRRIQSLMYYAKREDNFRMRSLKYARKYLHVEAMFWGPVTPVNTGFIAFQNITDRVPEFRIAANGVVLEADQSTKIVKKLKLIGAPEKILKKTAFIKDMFHSETEVAKFEGAQIQTQSGIRGIIKKSRGLEGVFRATFEDVIKKSDIIVLKTWAPVEVAPHCFCVRTLLLPPSEKAAWQGMKTVAQVKQEKGIKFEANPDSLYTPITERTKYTKLPLKIPRKLQKALPYHLKPRFKTDGKKADRVVVVKDPDEVKMDEFMARLKTMMNDKIEREQQEKLLRQKKFRASLRDQEHMKKVRERRKKSEACRKLSKRKGGKNLNVA